MAIEIGKVSVRVMPDTRGFAQKAKRDLKRLNDLTFKVDVELNEKQFQAKVKQLVAKTNLELMKPSNRIKFRASLEASDRQLASEVRDIRDRMQEMANEEKITLEAGLSKSVQRKVGDGGILGINPKKAIRAFERELKSKRYELPVYAQTSQAMKDIRRMARSSEFKIDVDLNADRKAIYEDVESIRELIEKAAKAAARTNALKFAIDVDRSSVKMWAKEVSRVGDSLKEQKKLYEQTQHELRLTKDRAADYGRVVSEATKRVARLNAQQANDLKREQKLVEELGEIRETIAKSAGDTTEEVIREKRIVSQIEELRRNAFARSAERAEAEAKAVAEIRDAQREITRLKKVQKELSKDAIKNAGELQRVTIKHEELQEKLDRARNKLELDAIELDVNLDQSSVEAVAARLMQLSRDRIVTIWTRIQKVNLDVLDRQMKSISKHTGHAAANAAKWIGQLTGVRVLWRTFRDMVDWLPRLDMMVPQLAQNLALVTTAAAGAAGALGLMFTLLSDIGEVGKLVLGLPAAVFGVAGSALILGRAIYDFKEVFPEIISYYKQLGKVVSDSVWKQAAGPIRELHKSLKPLLDAHVPDWSSAWGDSLGALAKGLGSGQGLAHLEMFLKNSIKGTKNAEKGWESLGNAIMRMVGAGSNVFPDLGTWFSDTMASFDAWAKDNQANIERWLREGGTALRELGSIGVSTVKIIAGIGNAFDKAGWPGLTELEQGMRSLSESALALSENGEFMYALEAVRDFFTSIKNVAGESFGIAMNNALVMFGKTVKRLTGPISGALDAIFDGFNSDKFQDGFTTFVDGLGSFIEDITPGIEAMTAEIGSLLGVVGTAGESWGPAFNDMLLLFSSAGDKLHPGLIEFIENTGPALQDLVKDITPHVEDFATAISDLLGNENFQQFVGDMIGTLGDLGGMILDFGTWVAGLVEDLADWYGSLDEGKQKVVTWGIIIGGAFSSLMVVLGGVALKISKAIMTIVNAFKFFKLDKLFGKLLGPVGRLISRAWDDIALRFLYFTDKLKGLPGKLATAIRSLADDIALRFMYLVDKLKGLGTKIKTALGRLLTPLTNFAKKFKVPSLKGIGGTLSKVLTPLLDWVKQLPGKLWKILPKGGLLKLVGKALTRFIPVVGWALLIRDALNLIKPVSVLDWIDGLLEGLGLGDSWLSDVVTGLRDNIEGAFGKDVGLFDLFNPITNAIRKAWDGMVAGFKEGGFWGGVKGFFTGLGDGFSDSFQLFWNNIKDAFVGGVNKIQTWAKEWEPTSKVGKVMDSLLERLPGLLGLNEDGSFSFDTMKQNWSEFGTELWQDHLRPWLEESWDRLVSWARQWEPLDQTIEFFEDPWGKIQEWLGITDLVTGTASFIDSPIEWGTNLWNNKIRPWLQNSWTNLTTAITSWTPVSAVIDFFEDPWGKIQEWLGIDDWDGGIPTIESPTEWGTNLWSEDIKPWLQESWDKLVTWWEEWNPVSLGFKAGEWLGKKLREWLGLTEDGGIDTSGFSFNFDFSSLWENKIKPALKTGLLALAGLILAPGLILIAPLALPALIIGWLLGRDGEGNWSFQELTDKITGAWENIKSAFSSGVRTIAGWIGGLVFTPIAIGKKLVEWLLGNDWVATVTANITSTLSGAKDTIATAVGTGVSAIKSAAESAGRAASGAGKTVVGGAGGLMAGVLGVDGAGKAEIDGSFSDIGGLIGRFTGFAASKYGSMSTDTGSHLGEMGGTARKSFNRISDIAVGETDGMKRSVVSKMGTMQVGAGAKMAAMQAAVVAKMGAMQVGAGAKMAAMQAAVIAKMGAMQVGAGAKMVAMQASISAAMISLQLSVVKTASAMGIAYVAQMTSMMTRAIAVAVRIRSGLLRVLQINATSPGRYTGGTFVSGLSSGLSRAASVARSFASVIRSALSFSAYSSGSTVGGTFASGLRARISGVRSAAHALARAARATLPNSPADEGPFSGSGWGGWGESIGDELAKGLRKAAPEVAREAERLMGGVHTALESRDDVEVGTSFARARRRSGLASDEAVAGSGTTVNVNVESRSEDPLQDGNRFGGDIIWALQGAGLA